MRSICLFDPCDRMSHARGLCRQHAWQHKKWGFCREIENYEGRGTGWTNLSGYKVLYKPGHRNSSSQGQIYEHVYIMSNKLGRPLVKGENVHHKEWHSNRQ